MNKSRKRKQERGGNFRFVERASFLTAMVKRTSIVIMSKETKKKSDKETRKENRAGGQSGYIKKK